MRLGVLAIVAALALPTAAAAYPQFQLSTGADRCQQCHFSAGGGGLINDYGRSDAGDTISRGGDGRFLHGLVEPPEWFQIGGDYRGAGALKHRGDQNEALGFPMQADLYLRLAFGPVSLNGTIGMRGAARDTAPPLIERFISREHYLQYQKKSSGLYVRAGRFFPIFGLRLADHTSYVRRYMGSNLYEEPLAVSAGWFGRDWEGHAAGFGPQPSSSLGIARSWGGTAYYEKRLCDDHAAVAVQTRTAVTEEDRVHALGTVGKLWLPRMNLLLLGELDLQLQVFDRQPTLERGSVNEPSRAQLAGYLGANYLATQGVWLGGALQMWEPDLLLGGSSRTAAELNAQYFPWAHIEIAALLRLDAAALNVDKPGLLGLLQVHYYL